jgi:hypothetical protein
MHLECKKNSQKVVSAENMGQSINNRVGDGDSRVFRTRRGGIGEEGRRS